MHVLGRKSSRSLRGVFQVKISSKLFSHLSNFSGLPSSEAQWSCVLTTPLELASFMWAWVSKDVGYESGINWIWVSLHQKHRIIPVFVHVPVRACMFVCVCERERKKEKRALRWLHVSRAMRKCVLSVVNNKGADQPAHPRSLISAFLVRCLDSIISLDSIAEIPRP